MCWPLSGGGSGSPSRSGSVCTLPPRVGLASSRVTSWPASTSSSAAESPASPPPTTTALISARYPGPPPSWPLKGIPSDASPRQRSSDHAQLGDRRQRRRTVEDVEPAVLDPFERGAVEPGEGRDARGAPAVEVVEQSQTFGEVRPCALGLEAHQLAPLGRHPAGRDVGVLDTEPPKLVLRQVDAAETPVLGDIANDVDQLQGDAESLGTFGLVGPIDADAGAPDRAGNPRAISAQVVEVRVARLLGVLNTAVDQRRQRVCRNRETSPSVGEGNEHRVLVRRAFEPSAKLLQQDTLLLVRQRTVGDVVDTARKRVDGGDRPPPWARQQHDPVGEVTGTLSRQALDLSVGRVDFGLAGSSDAHNRPRPASAGHTGHAWPPFTGRGLRSPCARAAPETASAARRRRQIWPARARLRRPIPRAALPSRRVRSGHPASARAVRPRRGGCEPARPRTRAVAEAARSARRDR